MRDAHHFEPIRADAGEPAAGTFSRGLLRGLVSAGLFLVAFVASTRFFSPPYVDDELFRAKVDYYLRHADEFDVVFFGTSRIYRGFDPAAFDEELAARGHALRSYNFGIPYCRPHELDHLLERVLTERPGRVKYVFVELMEWFPPILERLENHPRTIKWHTPRQTRSACRTIARADLTLFGDPTAELLRRQRGKLAWWHVHLSHLCEKSTNFGGGPRWFRTLFDDGRRHGLWLQAMDIHRGQIRFADETDENYAIRRRDFLENYLEIFHEQVAEIDAENQQPGTLEHFNVRAQTDQQRRLKTAHGVEPLYVIPNLRWGTPDMNQLEERGLLETVFSFNHVERYPKLYDVEHYFDRGHLNGEGAEIFSRRLARRFAEWLEASGAGGGHQRGER